MHRFSDQKSRGRVLRLIAVAVAALLVAGTTSAARAAVPDGIVENASDGTYSVVAPTTRAPAEIMQSFSHWQRQVFQDHSTAAFAYEDGLLSMDCSACGLTGSSVIALKDVDLSSIVAYEAGHWHLRMQSQDGAQLFSGYLRGEATSPQPDPALAEADRRAALQALQDLYDLASFAQGEPSSTSNASPVANRPTVSAAHPKGATPSANPARSLADRSETGDVEGLWALSGVHKRRDGGRPAPPGDLGRALMAAYAQKGRRLLLDGNVDGALGTLAEGRRTFGTSKELKDLEAEAVVIGDAYDRLSTAIAMNVNQHRGFLAAIRAADPTGYDAIEDMLARTLANRIADHRGAGRQSIASDLLTSGKELFPRQADRLTLGTAGALPQSPSQINSGPIANDTQLR
jgi:hypothetical protein